MPDDETVLCWIDDAKEAIFAVARRRGLQPRDFACTLVASFTNGSETLVVHIGDGGVVAKDSRTGQWLSLSWPSHGEYASTTFFVTDDFPKYSIVRHEHPISAIVAFSDGLERLSLDFTLREPPPPFFDGMLPPVLQSQAIGRDASLSRTLSSVLDGRKINAQTDDDKTIIIAALK